MVNDFPADLRKLLGKVRSDTFKIVSVGRHEVPHRKPADYAEIRVDYGDMVAYLFRTRSEVRFPEGELLKRMRNMARTQLEESYRQRGEPMPKGEQVVHLSPLSPVANEVWVFWEAGRLLIHLASDLDLENSTLWKNENLFIEFYNVDSQVVVSSEEAAGINAYLTRPGGPHVVQLHHPRQ
jgi:hypothetical protein